MRTEHMETIDQIFERIRRFNESPEGQAQAAKNAEDERRRLASEQEADRRAKADLWASSGTPRRIRELLAAGTQTTRAIERVQEWHANRADSSWCLVLSADKGAGKSVAAGWWLRDLDASGYKPKHDGDTYPRWWTGTDLAVLDWYGGAAAAVASMSGPLVIDDLGTEFTDAKGFFQQRLDALVDARYREYRPTLITTNLSGADFARRYGQRVADRIREGGAFFEFNGKSMRGAK